MRKCQTCGTGNPAGMSTCYACLEVLGKSTTHAANESLAKCCSACAARNPVDRTDCYVCGNPLGESERIVSCRRCGARNLASMGSCYDCSNHLDGCDAGEHSADSDSASADAEWELGNPAAWQLAERRLRAQSAEVVCAPSGLGVRLLKAFQGKHARVSSCKATQTAR